MSRSGKFYRKNEAEVMNLLGLKPTKNSGSGWIEKEDGQSENLICQLKSTDANSIKINKKDIDTLIYNAEVVHKLPVFAIQFLQSNEVYILFKPDCIEDALEYLKNGKVNSSQSTNEFLEIDDDFAECKNTSQIIQKIVKSSSNARSRFNEENERKFKKEKRSAT